MWSAEKTELQPKASTSKLTAKPWISKEQTKDKRGRGRYKKEEKIYISFYKIYIYFNFALYFHIFTEIQHLRIKTAITNN